MVLQKLKELEQELWLFKIEATKTATKKEKEALVTVLALIINEMDKLKKQENGSK